MKERILDYFELWRPRLEGLPGIHLGYSERYPPFYCQDCGSPLRRKVKMESAYGLFESGSLEALQNEKYDSIGLLGHAVWHRRVVELLNGDSAIDLVTQPLSIQVAGEPKILSNGDYYAVETRAELELDRGLFDSFKGNLCGTCGKWTPGGGVEYGDKVKLPLLPLPEKKPLLARWGNIRTGAILCSGEFVDLVVKHGWTGFMMVPLAPGVPIVNLRDQNWRENLLTQFEALYPKLCGY